MKRIFSILKEKWPEYILEILVITIGILGAFALNSWNENNKAKSQEHELLTSLKSDFEARLKELEEVQLGRANIMKEIDTILYQINKGQFTQTPEEFDNSVAQLLVQWTFNDQFSALDMLFATGYINELSNKELRQQLINWPTQVEEMLEEQRSYLGNYEETLNSISQHMYLNDLVKNVNIRQYDFRGKSEESPFVSNRKALLESFKFANEASEQRMYLFINLKDGQKLIDSAKSIIASLEKEIKK